MSASEIGRTLQAFARTTRARQLYATNNRGYLRMRAELMQNLDALLQREPVLSLRIRPDHLLYEDERVLEESNPQDSIPFALYRDGLRRMDFSKGVTEDELEALLSATAAGFAFSGLGEDIVSHLWKHDLEHIRYLVVDTSIVEAVSTDADAPRPADFDDVEAQIDGLLQAIYGESSDDVGPRAVHLDAADLGAKQIAQALDDVHDMAPGFHPARRMSPAPVYQSALLTEAEREDADRVAARATNAALRALHHLDGADADAAADGLLRIFDTAVMADDLPLATRIVTGVHSAPESPRTIQWLDEAVSEARVRHAAGPATETSASKEAFVRLFQFLQACGPRIVPLIVPMLGRFFDQVRRRAVSDLLADLGTVDLAQIRDMLDDGSAAVVQEGLHLLRRSARADAASLWSSVEQHKNPLARLALLESLVGQPGSAALNAATRLLRDPEVRVRCAAAQCLAELRHADVGAVVQGAVEHPSFDTEDGEVRRALLRAYARTSGSRALHVLTKIIKKGEGRLARRDAEDLATHAVLAAATIQDRRAHDLLSRCAQSKNRRVRETAEQVLRQRSHAP